jgi:rsbT co-antagonist protein RsbR
VSTPEPREAELAALRHRAAELTQEMKALRQAEAKLREAEQRLDSILEATNELIAFSVDGVYIEVNQRFLDFFGYERGEIIGKGIAQTVAPESCEVVARAIASEYTEPYEAIALRKNGERVALQACARMIVYQGRNVRVAAMQDISERKRAEEATREALVQREVISAREAILAELSMPLLPISDDIVVLPLIGAVNADRAAQVVRILVEGVARNRARVAILDITGVPEASDHVASALLHAARTVQLLGARVILTGIRPEVAQRLVLLDSDLAGLATFGTLESGVAHALAWC